MRGKDKRFIDVLLRVDKFYLRGIVFTKAFVSFV